MNNHHFTPERFWSKVNKTAECWSWTGRKSVGGYGRLSDNGRPMSAHRYSYELANGPLSEGMAVDHICRNRACVRPDHLRAATYKQNAENRGNTQRNNTSGVRGVTWNARANKWQGAVGHNGKCIYVGVFASIDDAEAAVTAKRNELFTHNDMDKVA